MLDREQEPMLAKLVRELPEGDVARGTGADGGRAGAAHGWPSRATPGSRACLLGGGPMGG